MFYFIHKVQVYLLNYKKKTFHKTKNAGKVWKSSTLK